jgi:hypothetical protein
MIKAFIISVFMSIGGASVVLAQVPDVLPTSPLPSGRPSREKSKQEGAAALKGDAESVPSSGVLDGQGMSRDGDSCSAGGKVCGPPGRFWVSGEYLLWWIKDARLPPLVTTGPANPAQILPPARSERPGPWYFSAVKTSI